MKNWTTQAEQRLAEYLRERAAREGFHGDDAVELKDDLRRHIHEEADQGTAETIGLMQLENILGRLDAGYRPVEGAGNRASGRKCRKFPEFSEVDLWSGAAVGSAGFRDAVVVLRRVCFLIRSRHGGTPCGSRWCRC